MRLHKNLTEFWIVREQRLHLRFCLRVAWFCVMHAEICHKWRYAQAVEPVAADDEIGPMLRDAPRSPES